MTSGPTPSPGSSVTVRERPSPGDGSSLLSEGLCQVPAERALAPRTAAPARRSTEGSMVTLLVRREQVCLTSSYGVG